MIEQVHVSMGLAPDTATITWASQTTTESLVTYNHLGSSEKMQEHGSPGERYSFLLDPSAYYPVNTTCQGSHNYTNPDCYYTSPEIHSVTLTDLTADEVYEFQVSGDTMTFKFNTGPAVGAGNPNKFAIIGDLGQTENSSHTVAAIAKALDAMQVDTVILAGDISYADGYAPKWDSWGRMFEYVFANVKTAYVGGNHEVASGGENWVNYKFRYPNQYVGAGSDSFLWYSYEQGNAHMVMLCSYAATGPTSAQYKWLEADLAKIDRTKTPWVIAVWHTPWYTSNAHHPMTEGAMMKDDMEDLMLKYEINVVISGHVHAYERTHPVAKGVVDCNNGINYITIGDGGNREQFATPWTPVQPAWSALREYAYGYGQLHTVNSTHALWQWWRDDDPWNPSPTHVIGDEAYFQRKQPGLLRC